MSAYDWTKFELRINVKVPIDKVYKAWATQDGIESWFLRSAKFTDAENRPRNCDEMIQSGDRYTWMWHGYGDDVVEINDILEANGSDFLSFVFGGSCLVTVKINVVDSETIVELTQSNIPVEDGNKIPIHIDCMQGWTFYLTNLKSILEGGLDLRNRNMNIGRVINS